MPMSTLILIAVLVVCWLLPHHHSETVTFTEGDALRIEDSVMYAESASAR